MPSTEPSPRIVECREDNQISLREGSSKAALLQEYRNKISNKLQEELHSNNNS
jgi:hypothetical protein